MEYNLNVEGETVAVSVQEEDRDRFSARIGDREYSVEKIGLMDGLLILSVNGKQTGIGIGDPDGGRDVVINGCPCFVNDDSMQPRGRGGRRPAGKASNMVTPPMPAVVVRVMVNEGDTVSEGQPVAVVSAMKMETTLYAPFGGRVVSINAAEGDKVSPGDILVDIEKVGE
ncbi:MAG: hypothetical protein B5M56_01555 [Desulfococcus sp. 4484_241]|nr:MAG: hypothetical protein B5M56_01555 [Desulfococcus sp. 4484_241]